MTRTERVRRSRIWVTAALALVVFAGSGCAARWAYRQGQDAAEKGDWDLAVARLMRAADKDPRNVGYKIALENARIQASRFHYDRARKHLAANELEAAAEELQIASNYDPANRSASDDLAIVRRKLEQKRQDEREREQFDAMRARARAAARVPVPFLSPRETAPITLNFAEGTTLQKIFEALGKLAGVNVLFDEGARNVADRKITAPVHLRGLSFQQALDRLTLVNRLFYKVLDQNTIIVAQESVQNRRKYDDILLRTFYLQNAEVADTTNLIKTVARLTTVAPNKDLGAITVIGTLDQIAIAERIIDANDKARGEIVVEVQILEVNRIAARDWGLNLSSYAASATLAPHADPAQNAGGVASLRAHLLSSLNQADWIVTIPSTIFTQFVQTEDTARILAAPRLRAAEGKKTELKIGTEIPIPVTSIGVGLGTGQGGAFGGYYPATSFQYRNVGVTMSLEPRVAASGDITLTITAEFSLLGGNRNVGTEANPLDVPTFLSRAVNATLRLRDGETGLIGGLVLGRESNTFAGALGVKDIPIIGKLLGSRSKEKEDQEILISLTPRIVRAPKLVEEDLIPLSVGTQERPWVDSVRPGLFGPQPETGGPETGGTAPETPQAPSQGRPVPVPVPVPAPSVPPAAAPENPPSGAAPEGPAGTYPQAPTQDEPEPPLNPPAPVTPGTPPEVGTEPQSSPGAAPPDAGPGSLSAAASGPAATSAAAAPAGPRPGTPARPMTILLSPPDVSLRVGQSAGFAVVLVGGTDVQWVEMTLAHEPALAEVVDVAAGSLLTLDGSPVQTERTTEAGLVRLRFARATPVAGSGGIAAITLKALRPGSGTLAVTSFRVGRSSGAETLAPPVPGRLLVAP